MPRFVHPPEPIAPPYWRGASDLAGDVGDLIYGSYNRSTNIFVKDGTAVAKRRGYTRAFYERFWGNADVTYGREAGSNYLIVGDGEGVKVLSSLVPKPNIGNGYDDPSYPVDNWNRSDVANIQVDDTGFHPWEESAGTRLSGFTGFEIVSNQLKLDESGNKGSLDIMLPTPSPAWVFGFELDLSNLGVPTGVTSTDRHRIGITIGLPLRYPLDPNETELNVEWGSNDVYGGQTVDVFPHAAPDEFPWMGVGFLMELGRDPAVSADKIGHIQPMLHVFNSTLREGDRPTHSRVGNLTRVIGEPVIGDTADEYPGSAETYYIEVGKTLLTDSQVRFRAKVWQGSKEGAPFSDPVIDIEKIASRVVSEDGRYINLISPDGNSGHFGIASIVDADTAGHMLLDNFIVKTGFTG